MSYTALAVVGVLAALVLDRAVARTRLTGTRDWWSAYAIIVFFQLLTNGWLTGRGIVTYSGDAILGTGQAVALGQWRVLFAPVEDIAFGFSLVLQTLAWWVFWGRRGVQRKPVRRVRRRPTPSASARSRAER